MDEPGRPRPLGQRVVPTLTEVLDRPALGAELPRDLLVAYYRVVAQAEAALRATLLAGAFGPDLAWAPATEPAPEADRWLSPDEAAARFGVTKRWLLDHQAEIPGRRRLSRKMLRFNAHFGHRDQSDRSIVISPIGGS